MPKLMKKKKQVLVPSLYRRTQNVSAALFSVNSERSEESSA